jgi:hypothetical protein
MRLIRFPKRERDGHLRTAVENESRLYGALKSLFDLLEHYGPVWYTKHRHDKAKTALVMYARTLKESRRLSRQAA